MKKFGLILFIFIAAFSAYLVWSYFAVSGPGAASVPAAKSGNHKLSQNGNNLSNLQENILSSGEKQIKAAKSFVAQIPNTADNVFNGIVDQTKNIIREKLNPILETTSSPAFQPAPPPVSISTGTASGSSQNSSAEPSVCFVVSKGASVDYGIEQPFSGARDTSYKIDWGDGEAANGTFPSGTQTIFVSHSYYRQGTFSVVFTLTSSSTTLTASRSVCVK